MTKHTAIHIRLLALVTLGAYLWVVCYSVLSHNHEDDHEHNGDHCENILSEDACHNFVYHGVSHEEEHDHEHLLEDEKECFACHILKSNTELISTFEIKVSSLVDLIELNSKTNSCCYGATLFTSIPRGPPSFA